MNVLNEKKQTSSGYEKPFQFHENCTILPDGKGQFVLEELSGVSWGLSKKSTELGDLLSVDSSQEFQFNLEIIFFSLKTETVSNSRIKLVLGGSELKIKLILLGIQSFLLVQNGGITGLICVKFSLSLRNSSSPSESFPISNLNLSDVISKGSTKRIQFNDEFLVTILQLTDTADVCLKARVQLLHFLLLTLSSGDEFFSCMAG
ncbi:hypothetical protein GCK72_006115 [Caenorhabditis remanei]|uniref:Uncharacterized protein n=1 Tax=Caenorhabditis remanei TaxID=31234 RepID=A0A6A5HFZ4_CAERE|nr:hypothetical protein GCK72_006115 [Caenorhabditis remanei]KAF1766159.1 hypothetical protein GCK72_006115 [Caenorhabditis remanei]